ncbi:DoxX family protein [Streptomyces sp. NPDC047061]|uniref:DoxX family protein n=1 Tax=Streptomyces sp. NPDC047061 TaxID=3154605 RepID=UPI0033FD6F77
MYITAVVLAVLLALAYLAAGSSKALGQDKALAQADHLGVPHGVNRLIGVLEVLGAATVVVGLWVAWLGVAAGAGLALLMAGAVGAHLRAKDPGKAVVPALALGLIALVYVFLRLATA